MKVWVKKILVAYLVAVVAMFLLAAITYHTMGPELGMKVQWAATCIAILPFQFVAWIIGWFSPTPGVIDPDGSNHAINNLVTWGAIIALVYFVGGRLLKKFKQALGGGGGGGSHH